VNQINTAMNQLNQTTQQGASASEELAATAEEMSAQAHRMQELMSFFKLGTPAVAPAAKPAVGHTRPAVKRSGPATAAALAEDADQENEFVRF
jgi:methyl-accepting chemotaxis protein